MIVIITALASVLAAYALGWHLGENFGREAERADWREIYVHDWVNQAREDEGWAVKIVDPPPYDWSKEN